MLNYALRLLMALTIALATIPMPFAGAATEALRPAAILQSDRRTDLETTLKAPGETALTPEEQRDLEAHLVQWRAAGKITDHVIEDATYTLLRERTQLTLDHSVRLAVVETDDALLGFPRQAGQTAARQLVYAYRVYDSATDTLTIYVTHAFYEQHLQHDAHLLAEVVDHEYAEQFVYVNAENKHAQASARAWAFADGEDLSPFHTFYLNRLAAESDVETLQAFTRTHPHDRDQRFYRYAQAAIGRLSAPVSAVPEPRGPPQPAHEPTTLQQSFRAFWAEQFPGGRRGRKNARHTLVNDLVAVGEATFPGQPLQVRLYPVNPLEPAGAVVGVVRASNHLQLAVAYDPATKEIAFPDVNEAALQASCGTAYDWAWLEGHLTLTHMRKLLTTRDGLANVVAVRQHYQHYIHLLQLDAEEERALRSNLATASYYLTLTGTSVEDVWNIYAKALSLTPDTLHTPATLLKKERNTRLRFKQQLIIATYNVAMKGPAAATALGTVLEKYAVLGALPADLDFRKQWLIPPTTWR